jgi:hypothetical protein
MFGWSSDRLAGVLNAHSPRSAVKRVVALARPPGTGSAAFVDRLLHAATHDTTSLVGLSFDVPVRGDGLYERFGRRPVSPPAWDVVAHVWSNRGTDLRDATAALTAHAASTIEWDVDEYVVWPYVRSWADGEMTPGVKQISFVAKPASLSQAGFEARYQHHRGVAAVHHADTWQYTQNVVRHAGTDDPARQYAAISEMWFRSVDDLVHRYYTTPVSRQTVQADTRHFIDPALTTWALVTELCVVRPHPLEVSPGDCT